MAKKTPCPLSHSRKHSDDMMTEAQQLFSCATPPTTPTAMLTVTMAIVGRAGGAWQAMLSCDAAELLYTYTRAPSLTVTGVLDRYTCFALCLYLRDEDEFGSLDDRAYINERKGDTITVKRDTGNF